MPGTRAKTASHAKERPPARKRARAFAFEGLPEKDRFGIFDPALRGFYFVGVMFGVVFGIAFMLAAAGGGPVGWAVGIALALFVLFGGAWAYGRIWPKPSERELLLSLAREDDEARALLAKLSLTGPAGKAQGLEPNGERAHE